MLLAGLAWGNPRPGHPEGRVASHVAHLLRTIDDWGETGRRRAELRLLALVHDSLKYRVNRARPRSGANHHAARARRFAENYIHDERLLAAIRWHDRPYGLWRRLQRSGRLDEAGLEEMLHALPDLELFMRFVELDASTEGKRPEPLEWFRGEVGRRRAEGQGLS